MITRDKWNLICILIILGMVAIMIYCIPQFFSYYDGDKWGVLFRSVLYCCMCICLILFISTTADQRISRTTFFFMCQISLLFLCMFLEIESWFIKCGTGGDTLLFVIYSLEDILFPAMIWQFSLYQRAVMNIDESRYRAFSAMMNLLLLAMALSLGVNAFTNCMFSVEDQVFITKPLCTIAYAVPVTMILTCAYTTFRHACTMTQKVIFTIYVVAPISSMLYMFPNYSASLTYSVTMGTFLLMYGSIYLDRGRALVRNEAALTEQKVAMMVSRIEPEFLKEAAESISSLEGAPEETRKALTMFIDYIEDNVNTVSLKAPISMKEELNHVITYTRLEKLRFKDKLTVMYDISDMNFHIPAMTLQMIVENAIKHGVTQRPEGGTVRISVRNEEYEHVITVTDDGVGFDRNAPLDDSRSHLGLSIISSRLKDLCNGTMSINSEIGKGTTVTIHLPKKL